MYDELTATPVPHPPVLLGDRRQKSGVKLSPGRREGWEEGVLRIAHYSVLI